MKQKSKNNNSLVRHFSPAWFAASMGIGGFANLLYQIAPGNMFFEILGQILWVINTILVGVLIVPWVLRWIIHFDKLSEDLKHPVMSNFFVTMPVAGIILATNFLLMGRNYFSMQFLMNMSLVIWIFGVVLALLFSVYITFNMMMSDTIHPNLTNFSWFIAPVASIIVPLLGNSLVKYYIGSNIQLANLINIIDLTFYGIGFVLFIILSSIVINRFIFHKMPHAMVLPTFWIILGPIGVGAISLMGLADANVALGFLLSTETIKLFAVIFWGFGLWAFGLILLITLKYLKNGEIPFSLSWWAFIFPLGAYSLASLSIYNYSHIKIIFVYTIILTILLSIIFIITFIKTIIGIVNKKLISPQI